MGSYNVVYDAVIGLLQILHKLGRGPSCVLSKHSYLSKKLIVSCCKIISHFVLNNNTTTKMSKRGDMDEDPFLNPTKKSISSRDLTISTSFNHYFVITYSEFH